MTQLSLAKDAMTLHLATSTASQSSTLSGVISTAVTLAIIVLLIVTRVRGRRLEPARLLIGPLVLMAVGVGSVVGSSASGTHTTLHGIDYLVGSIDLLDSLLVGTIRGFTVRLYERAGDPWYRYQAATVALWVLSILIRAALAVVGSTRHASPLTGNDLLFMLGLALLCQNAVIVRRHARHQPAPQPNHVVR
jgi:drug/metabolite transporter (DMT)-like permease